VTDAAVAFGAGVVSFCTPCVLPLVPAYLSAISIRPGGPRRSLAAALPFVIGFSAVFIVMGVLAGLAGGTLADHREQLSKLSGIVIVAMGLAMLGLLPLPLLDRTMAPAVEPARRSGSPLLLGGAFGLCWTPCVGPVLAALLALASSSRTAGSGAALLAAYSAGLAVPFLAAGVAFGKLMGAARSLRDHYDAVRLVSGCILVAVGLAMFFDRMYVVNALVNRVAQSV
jgi:cytochrome c-type biogenesis protein